jgi:hypothetical protein
MKSKIHQYKNHINVIMSKKIILLLLLFTLISCYNQERNCKDFKTGKFISETIIKGKKYETSFERNDSIQIEKFDNKIDTFSVRWINDCEYIMKNNRPKNREERKSISIRILNTKGKTYTFDYSYVGESKKQIGTVTKID